MSHPCFETHQPLLVRAVDALGTRGYFSAYPEVPSGRVYGETAKADGQAAFDALLGTDFDLDQPGTTGRVGAESSPWGLALDITYPATEPDELASAVVAALPAWRAADAATRTGLCIEILHRLNTDSFLMAHAVMHTTGQAFMMAFQAGGPHAQDRGLEAVACAWREQQRCPSQATWSKKVSKTDFVTLDKRFRIVPRGVGLVIGCATFPTWNAYPGLFASLATGNAVVVKPHPGAILPLALTVRTAREVLHEHGFDPNLVVLVADTLENPVTKSWVGRPEIGIVDYTGGSEFGAWVEAHAGDAVVHTEKAGVNATIIHSVENLDAVVGNIAFSLCLYAGQMCTSPRNVFIPGDGIDTGAGRASFDEVAAAIVGAIDGLLADPDRAVGVLGAIQSPATLLRLEEVAASGVEVLRASDAIEPEAFPGARIRTPLVLRVGADRHDLCDREMFGPIVRIVETADIAESIAMAARIAREQGAITCGVYSTDAAVLGEAEDALLDAGVPLSCNLTGPIWVNQSAAFSDFHVSGGNPAGNATLCDAAFVCNRFRVVQSRTLVPQPAGKETEAHAGV